MYENFSPIIILGILLSIGSLAGLLAEKVNLPRVVAYILIGVIFSPGILGDMLHFSTASWSPFLTNIALGIIAYIIGSEVDLQSLKKEKGTIMAAVLGQSLGAIIFVALGLWFLGSAFGFLKEIDFTMALIIGTIATATAPAASLGIIEEYGAKGKLTNTLLGVIAIDDAIGVILFTLVLGTVTEGGFSSSLMEGLKEIGGALLLGSILGVLLGYLGNRLKKEELRLVTILGFILLVLGLSELFAFSMLLSCMSLGFVSVMFYPKRRAEWILPLKHMEELVFIFFFTLAGIHFELQIMFSSALLVFTYMILRTAGKYTGSYIGMLIGGAGKQPRRLLGLCLFPQAGVAIGLAIKASDHPGMQEIAALLLNIILGSTIIFELTAPFFTRFALKKAGEIKENK
ncbi:MAG TPA: cation:proton antiporter [Salegentibacter sp.]|uniref:cation:proton antiporter n=1 Tax=Salegentibacter sp. TaxID=1903072 RepID=UPI002F954E37